MGDRKRMKKDLKFDYKKFNRDNLIRILSKFGDLKKLKLLYVSSYKPDYTRTETLINLFKELKIKYKTIITGNYPFIIKYLILIIRFLRSENNFDLIFVGFRGHEILPFIKVFTKQPIIFDMFISIYDTLCYDRKLINPNSIIAYFLKIYDKFLIKISDVCLVDTKTHKRYFEKEFKINNINYLYVDANTDIFKKLKIKKNRKEKIILWYGNALPLQGVDIILKSAKILEKNNIKFKLIGPIRKKYKRLIKELNLNNVIFEDFVHYKKLPIIIANSDICLGGHFSGEIEKAKRVISGKTFQFLACEKPVILGDNPANRELFRESKRIKFVKMGEPNILAKTIMELINE